MASTLQMQAQLPYVLMHIKHVIRNGIQLCKSTSKGYTEVLVAMKEEVESAFLPMYFMYCHM